MNNAANEQMRFSKPQPFYATERLIIDSREGRRSITHINSQNLYSAAYGVQSWDSTWMYVYPGITTSLSSTKQHSDTPLLASWFEMTVEYEPQYRGV